MPFDETLGYDVRTFDQWLNDILAKYEAESGIVVDPNQPSPTLDVARTLARIAKATDDDGAGTYGSGFVRLSTGAALQNLLEPFIGPPLADVASTVELPLDGTLGTLVTAGAQVTLTSDGANAVRWTLQADVTLPDVGVFAYGTPGPKSALAGSSWTIQTPVPGWATVGPNAADASTGRFAETEIEYRLRFQQATEGTRLLAAVLAVPGVTTSTIFENPTGTPDSFWGETHWVELLVEGGDNQAIGEAIQESRTFTVRTLGNVTVTVDADGYLTGQTDVRFSRPTIIPIWIEQAITKGEGYSTDTSAAAVVAREDAIRDQLVTVINQRPAGADLTAFQSATIAFATPSVPGIADIAALVGTSTPPLDPVVVAGVRDKLEADASRITLSGV